MQAVKRLTLAALLITVALFGPASVRAAQNADPGQAVFESRCASCHGADANGGEMGPAIVTRITSFDDGPLGELVRRGLPGRGMPGQPVSDGDLVNLVRFLRTVQRAPTGAAAPRTFVTTDGRSIAGRVLGEGFDDLQVRTDDGRVHLLRRAGDRVRQVTSTRDWSTYNGDPGGNRFTTLTEINPSTLNRLGPQWMFTVASNSRLQMTPVVVDGIMYVTAPNECYALDAGSGRQIWQFRRPRTQGLTQGGSNRGVAVAGDRVFMVTDNAHLIALNRFSGALLWESPMADWRDNYSATSAPLTAGELVVSGVTGGEHGANGFLAAFDQASGKEVWRFWTVPRPGEPGRDTWQGKDVDHGGAPTWFTGSYDPQLDLLYWPVGNPSKEYNGDDRQGDNLYANSILALERRTGRLRWYYQFTPHDLWDWDATQTSILADTTWQGQPRRLLIHASRNGFFYVFDRETGALLLTKAFVRNLTWASGIGSDGRPIKRPDQAPTPEGTHVCPSQDGATNWFSPSFNPATGLYYVQTFEKCSIYTKATQGEWQSGRTYLGGTQRIAPTPVPQRILKAIDIRTGDVRWELPQPGPATSWGGTLATSTGLVFFCEENGAFMAADALTGKPLWNFQTNQPWRASPMVYEFDGRQHIAVAAGGTIISFALK